MPGSTVASIGLSLSARAALAAELSARALADVLAASAGGGFRRRRRFGAAAGAAERCGLLLGLHLLHRGVTELFGGGFGGEGELGCVVNQHGLGLGLGGSGLHGAERRRGVLA
jgi:hypothetical protein